MGAPAAILCAVNDAIRPHGALVTEMPITPEIVLSALGTHKAILLAIAGSSATLFTVC